MASGHTLGALQPDGRRVVEPTFDPAHVAQTIVHLASLPNSVTVLDINIMCVLIFRIDPFINSVFCAGYQGDWGTLCGTWMSDCAAYMYVDPVCELQIH